jgi:glycopeptide antibiotics resistance protein
MQLKVRKYKTVKIIMTFLFLLYFALLIKVILFKDPFDIMVRCFEYGLNRPIVERISHSNFIPFKTILYYLGGNQSFGVAKDNLLGNIIAFGPLGFLLPIVFKRLKKVKHIILTAFILSLAFELTQLITSIGDFDIDDIILNVLGAICGYIVYIALVHLVSKRLNSDTNS